MTRNYSEPALARLYLLEDVGLSPEQADSLLATDPSITGRLPLQKKREELEAAIQEQADQEYAASPEGRKEAAKAALAAKQEREELIAGARALLERESGADVSDFDEKTLLDLALIEPSARRTHEREMEAFGEDDDGIDWDGAERLSLDGGEQ